MNFWTRLRIVWKRWRGENYFFIDNEEVDTGPLERTFQSMANDFDAGVPVEKIVEKLFRGR